MKELDLYKFVKKNDIEFHWENDEVITFIPFDLLTEFTNMIGSTYFSDFGNNVHNVHMRYDYICIHMSNICEYFNINMEDVFDK